MNDTTQVISFGFGNVVYQGIVKYPSEKKNAFCSDLIFFGQNTIKEQIEFLRNPKKFILEFWEDRGYEVDFI